MVYGFTFVQPSLTSVFQNAGLVSEHICENVGVCDLRSVKLRCICAFFGTLCVVLLCIFCKQSRFERVMQRVGLYGSQKVCCHPRLGIPPTHMTEEIFCTLV